ncbi:MAG: TIGR01777 family protein [Actinobacteria bacterium]|nr:MAG: TIGR01777 family protein [Actinomycetota bacterium]
MRLCVTGATGVVGQRLLGALRDAGSADEVTVLSRDPVRATSKLGAIGAAPAQAFAWEPSGELAPAQALAGRDAVVHLAGARIDQRWSATAKRAIWDSRVLGTRNLITALAGVEPRPHTLVSASGVGYYGPHGEEPLDEEAPAGGDFLAQLCTSWEQEAQRAGALGLRVVVIRTGIVLDRAGGALKRMLPPFRLGLGGPIAGGRQYMSWIHHADLTGIMVAALGDTRWSGAVNATAPEPVSNRAFSRALGRALKRPALMPLPALALRAAYGEMSSALTSGARVMPAKALVLGYRFSHPQLEEALRSALASA